MSKPFFKRSNSETLPLTKSLAVEFSTMQASVTERDLKQKRMDYLRDVVLGGMAISFYWSRARIADSETVYRINGHHSSTMLANLPDELFPEGLVVHVDDYVVDNKDSLALLFRMFDSRWSARSIDDIAGAYQGLQEDLREVPKKAGRAAVDGLAWYERNVIGGDIPVGDDKYTLFNQAEYHPFIQMAGRVLSEKTPEFSAAVVAAMFGTFRNAPIEAETFWMDVARQGGGNDDKHPSSVLDAWLVDSRKVKERKPKEREVYRACALAWNAFRNHRTLDRIGRYDPKKGAPDLE
jgi:hypothetical protein